MPKNNKFGFLHLSKIGDIPIRLHREVHGEIKGIIIKHLSSDKWYAFFLVDDGKGDDELTIINRAVGIDVGLKHYVVDSDGNEVENPHHLKHELKKLRRENRRLHKRHSGGKNCEKQRIIVARTYERVQNQRNDFQHKLSNHYIDNHDLIITEKLHPTNMMQNRKSARRISDAAWNSFNQKLAYKADRAGKLFVQVDPCGTSQLCPACGRAEPKTLSQRVHNCPCGYKDTRDHASSLVILERGLRKVQWERPKLTLADTRPLLHREMMQVEWMMQEASLVRAG